MNTLISSTHLARWASERSAEGLLPLLVGQLIRATATGVSRFGFPSGDSVTRPGFDGVLEVEAGNEFIPSGASVWEMGRSDDPRAKAEDDFAKRTESPDGLNPQRAAFVFVTPRRWNAKGDWARDKRAQNGWANVLAWDADDLEEWLRQAPAVAAWFCREIHNLPEGLEDIQWVWDGWASRTRPRLTPEVLLAGRAAAAEGVRDWLAGPASTLSLRAETADEALGVFAAVVESLPEPERSRVRSRAVSVTTPEAWRAVAGLRTPLYLVTRTPNGSAQAVGRGHHVLVAYGQDAAGGAFGVTLERPRAADLEAALRGMGLDDGRARDVSRESKGQMGAIVGLLGSAATTAPPPWSAPEHGPKLVPLLAAGSWGANAADMEAVAGLARTSRDDLDRLLSRWQHEPDPPLRAVGGAWEWISRRRAWPLLSRVLTREDLRLFREACLRVLGESDPRFDLQPEQRWMSSVLGRSPCYSVLLRQGLAGGLAMLATMGGDLPAEPDCQGYADAVVRELFGEAADPRRWYSLASELPVLAEASPDTFLQLVERDVVASRDVLPALRQPESPMGGGGRRHHLLWALERLAWSPDHLTRAAGLLAALTDPTTEGRSGNHPLESLRRIFLPWRPHTAATLTQRLGAVDSFARTHEPVAFGLCLALLPKAHDSSSPTSRPDWRAWAREGDPGQEEIASAGHAHLDRLIRWAGSDPERWASIVRAMPTFCPQRDADITTRLESLAFPDAAPGAVELLRSALRGVIHSWRTVWSRRLSPRLDDARLENVYLALEPADLGRRFAWLFGARAEILSVRGTDWQVEEAARAAERGRAIREMVTAAGPESIVRFAEEVEEPGAVGYHAAREDQIETQFVPLLERCLDSEAPAHRTCARGLVAGAFQGAGWEWVRGLFAGRAAAWPTPRNVRFACALPFDGATWDWVERSGSELADGYWREVSAGWVADPARDLARAVRSLVRNGRPFAAMALAGMAVANEQQRALVPPDLYLEVARAVTSATSGAGGVLDRPQQDWDGHTFAELLDEIERAGVAADQELAQMEWIWLPALEYTPREPRALQRGLSSNPAMFTELIRFAHYPESGRDDPPAPPSADDQRRARQAVHLLEGWRTLPGLRPDNTVDEVALVAWVSGARAACAASGHRDVGDLAIGRVLACAPSGSDGDWPHESVRRLLEGLRSERVERGLYMGIINRRGSTIRASDAGGEIERSREEQYKSRAAALAVEAPRLAAVMRQLANHYRSDARWQDDRRDLNEYR